MFRALQCAYERRLNHLEPMLPSLSNKKQLKDLKQTPGICPRSPRSSRGPSSPSRVSNAWSLTLTRTKRLLLKLPAFFWGPQFARKLTEAKVGLRCSLSKVRQAGRSLSPRFRKVAEEARQIWVDSDHQHELVVIRARQMDSRLQLMIRDGVRMTKVQKTHLNRPKST